MKHGDIVTITNEFGGRVYRNHCVVLMVTPKMIRHGIYDTHRPGLHLVRGYWYGTDPMDVRSYGKNEGTIQQNKRAVLVGRVESHEQIKKLGV